MKNILLVAATIALLSFPLVNFGQSPVFNSSNATGVVASNAGSFTTTVDITINSELGTKKIVTIVYNDRGEIAMRSAITKKLNPVEIINLPGGEYTYNLDVARKTVRTDDLLSQR